MDTRLSQDALGRVPRRAWDSFVTAMAVMGGALLVAMPFCVTYEVVARYAFRAPTRWVIEVSEYSLLWATFLGAPWLVRNDAHIRVDLVPGALPVVARRRLLAAMSIMAAGFCAMLAWLGIGDVAQAWGRGQLMPGLVGAPRWLVLAIIPLGAAVTAAELVRFALRLWTGRADARTLDDEIAEAAT